MLNSLLGAVTSPGSKEDLPLEKKQPPMPNSFVLTVISKLPKDGWTNLAERTELSLLL